MDLLITICARGGSKGIPSKNIKIISGQPLIAYTIKTAKVFSAHYAAILTLSTDDQKIAKVAADFGLESDYIRPEYLATDTAGKIETIKDILIYTEKKEGRKFDFILDLDVTSPFRTVQDLESAFTLIRDDKDALNIFSVSKAHRNPYFNMVEKGKDGYFKLVKTPERPILSRQTAPIVYDLNASFYFYRREFFEQNYKNAYTEKSLIFEIPHLCFDLDEPIDFEFMSYLLDNNKLNFEI
jgi:CMP-N-acetylneuraminic acid synthetase